MRNWVRKLFVRLLAAVGMALALLSAVLLHGWNGVGPLPRDAAFAVPSGAGWGAVAMHLQSAGAIGSARFFRLRARLFAPHDSVMAGEFLLPAHASEARILAIISGTVNQRRLITIPEGMPAVLVQQRLAVQPFLDGSAPLPLEGSVLPETYDFRPGEERSAVLARMQTAMKRTLEAAWAARASGLPLVNKQQALILASIVEKETGKPAERSLVAGLYENRLRQGMKLQADPTIIYPITQGKPLGRRIHTYEIAAKNGYNTYAMVGLPIGPITNPGKASIVAVLHPAATQALYMVADGTGGHVFATTLDEHNRNVARWNAIRRLRGD